jgi:uncharacterized membrane protein YphA (DoxX/SURF4 family)
MPRNRNLVLALRLFLGFVFIYAAVHKIVYPPGFAKEVMAYKILPAALVNLMAIFLPWLELLTGVALLAGRWTRTAATVVAALLAVFTVAIAVRGFRDGWDFRCGCFEEGQIFLDAIPVAGHLYRFFFSSPEATVTFARDLALLAMAAIVIRGAPPRPQRTPEQT